MALALPGQISRDWCIYCSLDRGRTIEYKMSQFCKVAHRGSDNGSARCHSATPWEVLRFQVDPLYAPSQSGVRSTTN